MSYIRCLSNPENLYIISNVNGRVEIFGNDELSLPRHIFDGALERWGRNESNVSYRGMRIEEIEPTATSIKDLLATKRDPDAYRWRISYRGWNGRSIVLYKVTLWYIYSRNVKRLVRRKRKTR